MNLLFTIIVTFFAGMGAGLGTGFAGMSAAAVISPMLITFLGMDPYMAVGIALSSDVLASAVSAYTYHKNKNLDIKNGLIMMASVLAFTVVGSWVASKMPSATMGGFSVFMTFLLGVKFILRPVMTTKEAMQEVSAQKRAVQSVVCGVLIGFICGFIGAGGGALHLLQAHYAPRLAALLLECEHPAEAPDAAVARRRIGFYLRAGARATALESRVFGTRYAVLSLPCGGTVPDAALCKELRTLYKVMVPHPYYRGQVIFYGS